MKKKQNSCSKFVRLFPLVLLFLATPLYSSNFRAELKRADSLFVANRYTQSFTLYKALFDRHVYSPSMLLKMAFIQEGLGKTSQSLYYLNLYYLASGDDRVLDKIYTMIQKGNFQGYDFSPFMQFRYALQRNYIAIGTVLVAVILLLVLLWYRQRKIFSWVTVLLVVCLGLLFAHTHFSDPIDRGIVTARLAYVMKGPSAGAPLLGTIGEGNQVVVLGSKDVWVHVKWLGRSGYIKNDKIAFVQL